MQRTTVFELKQLLELMPDDMAVSFSPIGGGFSGTFKPLRVEDFFFWTPNGDSCLPTDPKASLNIFLTEDERPDEKIPEMKDRFK